MFFKKDVPKSLTGKHLCSSLQYRCFPVKLATFIRTSFTEHLQRLLLWFLQKNNVTFSVILITLTYNQNCHGILQLLSPSLYKNIYLLSKVRPSISPAIDDKMFSVISVLLFYHLYFIWLKIIARIAVIHYI